MLRKGITAIRDWNAVQLALPELFGGRDRYSAVASQLMEAYQRDPGSRDLQLLVGFNYFGTGQYAKAANILLPLQKAVPADAAVTALLHAAENRLGTEGPGGSAGGGTATGSGGAGQAAGAGAKAATGPERSGP
jgi:predicted Zn-dependent protease